MTSYIFDQGVWWKVLWGGPFPLCSLLSAQGSFLLPWPINHWLGFLLQACRRLVMSPPHFQFCGAFIHSKHCANWGQSRAKNMLWHLRAWFVSCQTRKWPSQFLSRCCRFLILSKVRISCLQCLENPSRLNTKAIYQAQYLMSAVISTFLE